MKHQEEGDQLVLVTASELGQFVFCPEANRLALLGMGPRGAAKRRMAKGNIAHDKWQKQEDKAPERERKAGWLALLLAMLLGLAALVLWVGA